VKPFFYFVSLTASPKCQNLTLGGNARVSPSNCLTSFHDYGSNCYFSCAQGYQVSGRRLFGVELWETGARMRAQSTVGVCIKLLLSTVVHIFEEKTNSGLRVLWDGLFRPLFLPFTHTSRFCPIVTLMGFLTQKKFANNHSFVTRLQ